MLQLFFHYAVGFYALYAYRFLYLDFCTCIFITVFCAEYQTVIIRNIGYYCSHYAVELVFCHIFWLALHLQKQPSLYKPVLKYSV